ncbi:MAG: hypothetical protein JNJ85_07020 [Candidatus Kapabacteria bacterium]|nr:hypothetical protein [Candidatus Kapabacteria bacterium]
MNQRNKVIKVSKAFSCLAFFCLYAVTTTAQMHVTRFATSKTVADTFGIGELFGKSGFAGEMRRAINKVTPNDVNNGGERTAALSRDQAWVIAYGGYLDCYRFDSVRTITGTFFHEINANAMNDIGFNPRAVQWEERLEFRNLLYYYGFGTSIGIFHRCKHDIDNSDLEHKDTPDPNVIRKRGIILTGVSLSQSLINGPASFLPQSMRIESDVRLEYYVGASDYRYPLTPFGNDWGLMKAGILYTVKFNYELSRKFDMSLRLYVSGIYIGENTEQNRSGGWVSNQRNEFAINLRQPNNTFSVVLVHESLFDDITRVTADPTNVVSLGIRTTPNIFY